MEITALSGSDFDGIQQPECWIRKTSGGTDLFGRLWWERPSVTIRTEFFKPEKGRYLHPEKHRPITHREAARLMGFPDDFQFVGSKTEIAKQIGNAVTPQLAGALAKMTQAMLLQLPAVTGPSKSHSLKPGQLPLPQHKTSSAQQACGLI